MPPKSPLAPAHYPTLPPIKGVRMAALNCGIRYKDRKDLMLMEFAPGTTVAGVFTKSLTAAAPVERCQRHLRGGQARALLVNSGNANAFTGNLGEQAVTATLARAAELVGCEPEECFVSSTGVIGEPLPYEKILAALPEVQARLSEDGWQAAAEAIMTTDTFPKMATRTAKIGAKTVTINGIAKGSGMIAPDMATMLAYIATDAAIPAEDLQSLLAQANETTFNAITVDSDTSTSDTVLLFATGQAKNRSLLVGESQRQDKAEVDAVGGKKESGIRNQESGNISPHDSNVASGSFSSAPPQGGSEFYADFRTALHSLMQELAALIVRDGEGARKFVTVKVEGAESPAAAKIVALAIANSPLIKTAIAGEDANWGRVVMAVGKAGQRADRDRLKIWFGPHLLAENGLRHPDYDEKTTSAYMKQPELELRVDLGVGQGAFTVYTCDLTEGYIRINADYRS